MTPLGWKWAGLVWAYALIWALLNDRVKLLAYRIFDPVKKSKAAPDSKPEIAKAPLDSKPQPARTPSELKPAIAKRAYELYEKEGHNSGHADQDWLQAEQEIEKAGSQKT